MATKNRARIMAGCYLLVLLCALFPPRTFSPDAPISPGRKFLFSPEIAVEHIGTYGTAAAHIDTTRFAAELLVILCLTGLALLAAAPRH